MQMYRLPLTLTSATARAEAHARLGAASSRRVRNELDPAEHVTYWLWTLRQVQNAKHTKLASLRGSNC